MRAMTTTEFHREDSEEGTTESSRHRLDCKPAARNARSITIENSLNRFPSNRIQASPLLFTRIRDGSTRIFPNLKGDAFAAARNETKQRARNAPRIFIGAHWK